MSGLIAIVGRPNVGKSALFNRLVGRRIAIVHDEPGVTRDRISAEAEWRGRRFTLVDTGGIGLVRGEKTDDAIAAAALQQVQLAIEAADAILLVVNAQEGLVPLDLEVAQRLRRSGKPVLVVANKVDTPAREPETFEFARLGFDRVFPVSAIHGHGVEAMLKAALPLLPQAVAPAAGTGSEADASPHAVKLAIVGRPNVGKSSLINALTRSERVVVSPVPGTTRDAVDVPFEVEVEGGRERFILIDTAGVRKKRRIDSSIEYFSVQRTEEAISRSDLVIFMLDAGEGIIEQDKKIADLIVAARRACIVCVNKWDLAAEGVRRVREEELERRRQKSPARRGERKQLTTLAEFGEWVQQTLFFLDYAPVIFASATEGFNLARLLDAVRYVAAQLRQRIPTALLNRALQDAIERRQPVSATGQRLKFFYATQVQEAPPTFLLFVNRDGLFSDAYAKYLADQLRRAFGFEGCPIVLVPKPRPRSVAPVRTARKSGHPVPARRRPRSVPAAASAAAGQRPRGRLR
jgi:GTP-binding protein